MKRRIPSFIEFVTESDHSTDEVIEESVDIQALAQEAGKDDNAKNKLISALKKQAPSLADDEKFMKQFLKSLNVEDDEK
jgi:hypothetical protein